MRWWFTLALGLILLAAMVLVLPMERLDSYRARFIAVKGIADLHTAQARFYSSHHRYAGTLREFGGLIDPELARGERHRIRYWLFPSNLGYELRAMPSDGARWNFYSDETRSIHARCAPRLASREDPLFGGLRPR